MSRRLIPLLSVLAVLGFAGGLFLVVHRDGDRVSGVGRLAAPATGCGDGPGSLLDGEAPPDDLWAMADVVGRFWQAYVEDMESLSGERLAALTEGEARAELEAEIGRRREQEIALRVTTLEHVPLLRGRQGDTAWVRDAVTFGAQPVDARTGEPRGDEERAFMIVDLVLRQSDHGWRIAERRERFTTRAEPGRCPLSADLQPYTTAFRPAPERCGLTHTEEGAQGHTFAPLGTALRLGVEQEPLPDGELAAIEEAIRCYWAVSGRAYRTLDPTGLDDVATGNLLAWLRGAIAERRQAGRALREDIAHRQLLLLQYTGDQAVVDDWVVVRAQEIDAATGRVLRTAPEERMLLSAALVKEDGRWRLAGLSRVGRSPVEP